MRRMTSRGVNRSARGIEVDDPRVLVAGAMCAPRGALPAAATARRTPTIQPGRWRQAAIVMPRDVLIADRRLAGAMGAPRGALHGISCPTRLWMPAAATARRTPSRAECTGSDAAALSRPGAAWSLVRSLRRYSPPRFWTNWNPNRPLMQR